MRIFLTGFMGSGKSYVGKRLAEREGLPFMDLDDCLEQQEGMSIAQIFAERGEDHFRAIESRLLRGISALPMFVMATGGGTPCFHENMEWMNACGLTVFIDPTVDILTRRLRSERDKRPLLHSTEELSQLISEKLHTRRLYYEKADFHVRQTNPKQDVVRSISAHLLNLDAQSLLHE